MKNYPEHITDRIEQSFSLFKNNFINLVYPVAIYFILIYYFFENIWLFVLNFFDSNKLYSPLNIEIIIWIILLILIYLTIYIWVIIWLYKTILDIDNEKKYDLFENYKYWFLNIFNLFKTYFFIFMYVFFIPSIIFILGWFIFIYFLTIWEIVFTDFNKNIFILLLGLFLYFIFSTIYVIYKSNKSVFALISAVIKSDFTKENFNKSLYLTNWNWWRIFWNFLLIGIIIWLFNLIINLVLWASSNWLAEIIKNYNNIDQNTIVETFKNGYWFNIKDFFSRLIIVFTMVFISIFTYIFYKRLEIEKLNFKDEEKFIEKEKIL